MMEQRAMTTNATQAIWDTVHAVPDGWYPNEFIVRFLAKYVRKRTGLKTYQAHRSDIARVLDLGCGHGAHLVMLARDGYQAHGIDISQRAVDFARQWLEHEHLSANVELGSATALPWEDGRFDAVISHGVLDHMPWEGACLVAREVARVLKPTGLFYLSLVSTRESGFGQGQLIDKYTCVVPDGIERGTVQRFFTLPHVMKLLEGSFEVLDIVHDEWQAVFGRGFSALDKQDYPRFARFHIACRKP